jgi:hypothetical protein
LFGRERVIGNGEGFALFQISGRGKVAGEDFAVGIQAVTWAVVSSHGGLGNGERFLIRGSARIGCAGLRLR